MARKIKTRKTKPISGRIMRALDVSTNDKSKVKNFLDMVKSGRTIIVLVYANWCGHCHTFKPRFDKAANSGNSQIAAAIESEALPAINASLPKSISVDGYPSLIVVGDKGNQVASMNTPQGSETEVISQLNNVMKNLNSVNKSATPVESVAKPSRFNIVESDAVTVRPPSVAALMEEPEEIVEEESVASREKMLGGSSRTKVGGSLYAALGAAAVQLAPSGILLGIHSLMRKRHSKANKSRKTRKVRKYKI